jgi:hypothetical protein
MVDFLKITKKPALVNQRRLKPQINKPRLSPRFSF